MNNRSERLVVPENRVRVPFRQDTKDWMRTNGWRIISASGKPINLPDVDKTDFWRRWEEHYPDPDAITNIFEVAIPPDEQINTLAYSNVFSRANGFTLLEGSALDHVRIASVVFRETGRNLFDQDRTTRTTTVIDGTRIHVGGPNGPIPSSPFNARNVDIALIAIPYNFTLKPNLR